MTTRNEKTPRRLAAEAGQDAKGYDRNCIPVELRASITFCHDWIDVSEGWLSSYWQFLIGMQAPDGLDYTLTEKHFPTPETWAVARALIAHARTDIQPTIKSVASPSSTGMVKMC